MKNTENCIKNLYQDLDTEYMKEMTVKIQLNPLKEETYLREMF
jgi:hypothetical protein